MQLIAAFSDVQPIGRQPGNLQISGLYITAGSAPNTFDLGIGANRAGIAFSSDLTPGQTYFVVGSFVQGSSDTSSLWINPVLGQSSTTPTLTETGGESGGANDNEVNSFALNWNPDLPTGGVIVDELRVGTTFADVTPAGIAVPEPSTLIALLGCGAVGSVIAARRRSRSRRADRF